MFRAETQVSWLIFLCSLDTNGRTDRIILKHLFGFYLWIFSVRLSSSTLPLGLLLRVNPLGCWFLTLVNSWSRRKGLWPNRFNAVFKRLSSFQFCTAFSMLMYIFSLQEENAECGIPTFIRPQNSVSPLRALQGESLLRTLFVKHSKGSLKWEPTQHRCRKTLRAH